MVGLSPRELELSVGPCLADEPQHSMEAQPICLGKQQRTKLEGISRTWFLLLNQTWRGVT